MRVLLIAKPLKQWEGCAYQSVSHTNMLDDVTQTDRPRSLQRFFFIWLCFFELSVRKRVFCLGIEFYRVPFLFVLTICGCETFCLCILPGTWSIWFQVVHEFPLWYTSKFFSISHWTTRTCSHSHTSTNWTFIYSEHWYDLRLGWLLVCCLYKEIYLQIFKRVSFWLHGCCGEWEGWARKPG